MSKSGTIQKILAYVIPIVTLIVFLLILTSVSYIKSYSETGKAIPNSIDRIEQMIEDEVWEEASSEIKDLHDLWNKITPLIQISANEEDIKEFSRALVRLEGYLKGEDQSSAFAEIGMLRYTWDQLEN